MTYFQLQKKLLKKTLTFNKYVIKSGLLDLLCLLLFFVMLLIVFASFQYFTTAVNVYEQDYSAVLQDETLTDTFKEDIANDYVQSLKILMSVILISLTGMIVLSYLFGTFIKPIQYNMLKKSFYKNIKQYFKIVWCNFRNTLPLFIIIWSLIFGLFLIFKLILPIIIINLLLFLIYWAYLPILRLSSMKNKSFKKTWIEFFKLVLKSSYFMPVVKLSVLMVIILFVLFAFISSLIKNVVVNIIVGVLQVLVIIFIFIYLRKYLFIIVEVLRKKLK